MKTKLICFIFLFFACAAFTTPVNEVKLEYIFKVGDAYTWTQLTKQTIKQSIMGMEQNAETEYAGEITFKVVALTATGAKLEATFIKLKNGSKSAAGEMVMDSEGAEDNMQNKLFKSLMNKPFYILMSKRGVIERVEEIENLWTDLGSLGLDEAAAQSMKQSMDQVLGKDALKGSFEQAFIAYPDKKVKQGETWSSTTNAPMSFPIQTENTWNLASLSGATAKINADGIFTTTDKEKTMNLPGGMKAKTDLSGKQLMKSNVDVKTGWPTTLDVISELKGTMTLLAGGMIPEDMTIPMEILSESTYKIVKK